MTSSFSPALFKALVDALQPTDVSIKVITTIAMANLGFAREIVDILERRMCRVGVESLDLRMLWVIVDHMMKAAPLIYAPLWAPYVKGFVEDRVAWESDDALIISLWVQRLVASWIGLLPIKLWKEVYDSIRQRRTRMYLEKMGGDGNGVDGAAGVDDDESFLVSTQHHSRLASNRQLDQLKTSWDKMLSMATRVLNGEPIDEETYEDEGHAYDAAHGGQNGAGASARLKRLRTEGGAVSSSATATQQAAVTASTANVNVDDDDDFDLGGNDNGLSGLDANGHPVMALPEIQLPMTARAPRRRR